MASAGVSVASTVDSASVIVPPPDAVSFWPKSIQSSSGSVAAVPGVTSDTTAILAVKPAPLDVHTGSAQSSDTTFSAFASVLLASEKPDPAPFSAV